MSASANRTKIKYSAETSWGETPAAPAMKELVVTQSTLSHKKETVQSQSIRSDRQVDALPQVGVSADGNIGLELSSAMDELIEAALMGTFTNVTRNGGTFAGNVALAGSTITFASATDYDLFAGANAIKISGSATAGNNKSYAIIAKNSVAKTFTLSSAVTADDSTTTAALTLTAKYVRNGVTPKSFLFEVGLEDISKYFQITGVRVNTLALTLASRQIVTAQLGLIGKTGLVATNATIAGSTTAAATLKPLSASANVGALRNGASTLSGAVASLNLNVANNLSERPVIGSNYSLDHNVGEFALTGSLSVYFEGADLYENFRNHDDVSLQTYMAGDDGKVLAIDIARFKFADGPVNISGKNQSVQQTLNFTALRDETKGYTLQIDLV